MNFFYRITKYNPMHRDKSGAYTRDEWTSYHDIGDTFNNTILTLDTYLKVEQAYITSILEFMQCVDISLLYLIDLEKIESPKYDANSTQRMIMLYEEIVQAYQINLIDVVDICRLILRDFIWCKLENEKKLQVHLGYDFYMYIVSALACKNTIEYIQSMGLFVENYYSPYL